VASGENGSCSAQAPGLSHGVLLQNVEPRVKTH
jgi:hypothetical protein